MDFVDFVDYSLPFHGGVGIFKPARKGLYLGLVFLYFKVTFNLKSIGAAHTSD